MLTFSFSKFLCGSKKTIIDYEMDKTYHNDSENRNRMYLIKQKIEHYVILTEKELEYIRNLEIEDIYDLVLWYNKNNAKY